MKKIIDLFIVFFFLCNIFLVTITGQSVGVNLSFLILLLIIVIGLIREMNANIIRISLFIYLFGYFFMFLAPLMQLNHGRFPNLINFDNTLLLKGNTIIIIFYLFYLVFDILLSKRKENNSFKKFQLSYSSKIREIYYIIAILFSLVSFVMFRWEYFASRTTYSELITNGSLFSILFSGSKGIVTASFTMEIDHFKKNRNNIIRLFIASVLMVYNVNPFNVSRYYISYVLILLCLVFFQKKIRVNYMIILLIVGLVFIFPLLNFFRHGFNQINFNDFFDLVKTQFVSLHFDSYSQLLADIKYIDSFGYSYGLQFLSVLLFFVPRSIFPGKFEGSGAVIGQFLNQYTDFYYIAAGFSNVSNPFIGEIFLNFGIIGILIAPIILVLFLNFLNNKHYFIYLIICSYSIFIMRGDLMSSFAYCVGTIVFLALIPKLRVVFND